MNRGIVRGIGPAHFLPPWMGSENPANDGSVVIQDSTQLGRARLGLVPNGNLVNILDYGADPTGVADNVTPILNAVAASLSYFKATGRGIYVPPGTYKLSSLLDLSTAFAGASLQRWSLIADPGATFKGHGMVISPGATGQLLMCYLQLPRMDGTGSPAATIGVKLRAVVDSYVYIPAVYQYTSDNIYFDCTGTPPTGIFNNFVLIGESSTSAGVGVHFVGNTGSLGTQANIIQIQHVISSAATGVKIDDATGQNTSFNHFLIGVCESNSGWGVLDFNGHNIIRVGNTNNNGSGGYRLATGATGVPDVLGFFTDTTPTLIQTSKAYLRDLWNAVEMVPYTTTTTAPSAGGAGALPATPAGYYTVNINGTNRQVPYY